MPTMRTAHLVGSTLLTLLSACGDLTVRREAGEFGVPSALEGEWTGTWTSSRSGLSGPLTIRVQEFDEQPVVGLWIDNPCLAPRVYEIVFAGSTLALVADGVTVFSASIVGEAELLGEYTCEQDAGAWLATRQRDLPPLGDVSGQWDGTLTAPGAAPLEIRLSLQQVVRGGALVVEGFAALPELLPFPVPVAGIVDYRESDFALQLSSGEPGTLWFGVGDRAEQRIDMGLLQVLGGFGLPFETAVFQVERAPD